jgi:hypothetical protein
LDAQPRAASGSWIVGAAGAMKIHDVPTKTVQSMLELDDLKGLSGPKAHQCLADRV